MQTSNLKLIKRFMHYYKPHKKLFFIDMLSSFSVAALGLTFPLITQRIVNVTIPEKNLNELFLLAILLVLIYMFVALFTYIVNYHGHVMGVKIEADIRKDLFSHLQKLSFRYYDNNRTGQILSKLLSDLFDITELAHHGPEDIFISGVMFIGSAAILFNIEWRLTLCIIIMLPIFIWFASTKRKKMRKAFREVKAQIADVNSQLENSISGIRVSQSFNNEHFEIEKFSKGNELFKNAKSSAFKAMGGFMSGMGFLANITNVTVLIVGAICIYYNTMNLSDLLVFMLYINLILQPIARLTNFTQQFEQGMSGFRRFLEVMDTLPEIADKKNAKTLTDVKGEIVFDNVTFKYNQDEEVLNNISFSIPAGKTVALVGPSGGGKTTVCQLIPRFYECIEGGVTIDGTDVRDITLNSLRDAVGIVQQDVFLFSGTIMDNIRYGDVNASMEDVITAAKRAKVHDFIMSCPEEYETNVGEKGIRLSGGQKQRISIARAFLKNPPIMILDEATSALDNETEAKVQQSLNELAQNRTTLVIAHRLSTVKNADTIIVLTKDGVAEKGSHEELYAMNGIYTGLYDIQFKLAEPDLY